MSLQMSPEDYAKQLWDWGFLDPSFDRGIRMGDLDGFVEVGNRFLFLEGKRMAAPLSVGQRIALTRLSRMPHNTVVVVRGQPPNEVTGWEVLGVQDSQHEGNRDALSAFVRRWFEWADSQEASTENS